MLRLPKEVSFLSTLIYYDRVLARACHKDMKRFFLMHYLFDSVMDYDDEIWMVCEIDTVQLDKLIDAKLDLLGAFRKSKGIWIASVISCDNKIFQLKDKITDKNLYYDLTELRNMRALMVGSGFKFFQGELDDIRKQLMGEK